MLNILEHYTNKLQIEINTTKEYVLTQLVGKRDPITLDIRFLIRETGFNVEELWYEDIKVGTFHLILQNNQFHYCFTPINPAFTECAQAKPKTVQADNDLYKKVAETKGMSRMAVKETLLSAANLSNTFLVRYVCDNSFRTLTYAIHTLCDELTHEMIREHLRDRLDHHQVTIISIERIGNWGYHNE